MVIGTAWTHKHLRRIAKTFVDVLFVDATEGTNDEERPLLTLSFFLTINGGCIDGSLKKLFHHCW
eukprot:4836069-Ditylum_brightwellii.AAC.1